MLMVRKAIKVLFDTVIAKTPESWRSLRNWCVRKYAKCGGGISPLVGDAAYIEIQ